MNYIEIETIEQLYEEGKKSNIFSHYAFQDIDFSQVGNIDRPFYFDDCIFLGCIIPEEGKKNLSDNCLIFPQINVPYDAFRSKLYTAYTLYEGYDSKIETSFAQCYDQRVYSHYRWTGMHSTDVKETLARSMHDHSISNAMNDFLRKYEEKQVVGIMGGHGLKRTEDAYKQIVTISKTLTENGKLMISGGGPGAMEATHLGAWMAGRKQEEVEDALSTLSVAPLFTDEDWLSSAFAVIEKYPQTKYHSLGIPTWLYGHEPTTPFATEIAKYFDNSIREDGILSIAKGGIIYTPGSAGTMQEVFQEAVQNHYLSFGYASPMAFMGVKYWTEEMPIYPLLQHLLQTGKYKNLLLSLSDNTDDVVKELMDFV